MQMGEGRDRRRHPGRLHRLAGPGHRAGRRRPAAWPGGRNLRPGIVGQDHALTLQVIAEMQKLGGTCRLHRCRARARSAVRPEARRQRRRPADLAARHRRAGAGNRRHAGALRRGGPDRGRLGGRADPQGRNRRRDGRPAARPAGPPDEPGAAQAHCQHQEDQLPWSSSSTRSA